LALIVIQIIRNDFKISARCRRSGIKTKQDKNEATSIWTKEIFTYAADTDQQVSNFTQYSKVKMYIVTSSIVEKTDIETGSHIILPGQSSASSLHAGAEHVAGESLHQNHEITPGSKLKLI